MGEVEYAGGDLSRGRVGGPRDCYPNEYAVASSGTAVGSPTAFETSSSFVSVIADKDVFFAKTLPGATPQATGGLDDRHFAAAGERRVLPRRSSAFFCVNAVAGETPKVRVEGWL